MESNRSRRSRHRAKAEDLVAEGEAGAAEAAGGVVLHARLVDLVAESKAATATEPLVLVALLSANLAFDDGYCEYLQLIVAPRAHGITRT